MTEKQVSEYAKRFLHPDNISPGIYDMIEYIYYSGVVEGRMDSSIKIPPGTFELGENQE